MGRITRANRNIAWIEKYLRVPEGRYVGRPFKLTAHQKREIRLIYTPVLDRGRRVPPRRAILSKGRKNAKTTLAACLLLLHLCGPEARENPNSQLYSAAQSKEQAGVVFNLAMKMVRMSPALHAVVGIRENVKQLYCEALGTLYRALSAEASTAFGLSPAFVIHDELGQVKGPRSRLYEALETAQAAHENPLSVIISTQAETDADLLSVLIDDAMLGGDPRTVIMIRQCPVDVKPFTKRAIRLANPEFDTFMNQDEVLGQMRDAQRMPAREGAYRNLVLNQRTSAEASAIDRAVWMRNQKKPSEELRRVVSLKVALDLSSRHDLTAAAVRAAVDGRSHAWVQFFAPREQIEYRSIRDRVPYDLWARQGWIQLTPGASVEYSFVARWLLELTAEAAEVEALFFDPWRMDVIEAALAAELEKMKAETVPPRAAGVEVIRVEGDTKPRPGPMTINLVRHGQGYKDFSPSWDALEGDLLNARCLLGNNPVLTMCAANAVVDMDSSGNRKLNKRKATGRIDGLVALAMTYGQMEIEAEQFVSAGVYSA